MANMFRANRALLNNSFRTSSRDPFFYVQRTVGPSRARFLSTAFERAEGSNAVAETSEGDRGTGIPEMGTDPVRDGMYEAKQEALDPDEGRASAVTGHMADRARDGPEKAKEMVDRVGETAKKTMDGAWKAARETTEEIKEAAVGGSVRGEEEKRGPNYENLEGDENVEDLRRRAGGYDKAE
ncbi:hypothetical protein BT93_F1330 [Corymbia citriodora subsp. variegata]|nr:hypothetical protein BT93_F1330 [Corymbia citriodora subsp. variegata]